MILYTYSEQETKKTAKKILAKLGDHHVILLQGNLGSGKTVLVKGLAEHFDITEVVNSPTFVIMKIYPVVGNDKFKRLVHVDLYRLESMTADQLQELGLDEYLGDHESLVVIEWSERLSRMPARAVVVRLSVEIGDKRKIEVNDYKSL